MSSESPASQTDQSHCHDLSKVDLRANEHTAGDKDEATGEPAVSTKGQLLTKIELLSGLVLAGFVTVPRANSAHNMLSTLLKHSDEPSASTRGEFRNEDVLKTLREAPHMLAMIKQFLSKDQIDLIMQEAPHE